MNLEDAKRLLPLTGHAVHLNPPIDSRVFIARQRARIERLCADPGAHVVEINACGDNLRKAAGKSWRGWCRVHVPHFPW